VENVGNIYKNYKEKKMISPMLLFIYIDISIHIYIFTGIDAVASMCVRLLPIDKYAVGMGKTSYSMVFIFL